MAALTEIDPAAYEIYPVNISAAGGTITHWPPVTGAKAGAETDLLFTGGAAFRIARWCRTRFAA
ncbi:hypothetical protein [Actinoplanes sp. NPDC051494]|uniref:hypothetical protein n=1 Tax=Actinoplanes sp. NPDC051494 TaxID=3363907 RepID=UPI00379F7371